MLNDDLETTKKHEELARLRSLEVARRINKNAGNPQLAPSIYAVYSQTAKTKKLVKCKVDASKFADQIQIDEDAVICKSSLK